MTAGTTPTTPSNEPSLQTTTSDWSGGAGNNDGNNDENFDDCGGSSADIRELGAEAKLLTALNESIGS